MRSTPYHHYALYEPDAAPDLTETGEYNSAIMGIDADLHAEETERKAADTALTAKIAAETKDRTDADAALDAAYKAADTAIGARIDNAEAEISANSADLTGIKGLTYGEGGQVFLENENGSYSSPALVEIRHEISNLQSQGGGISGSTTWGEIKQP